MAHNLFARITTVGRKLSLAFSEWPHFNLGRRITYQLLNVEKEHRQLVSEDDVFGKKSI